MCVSLSLCLFRLSLSLSPSVFLLPGALSPCLSFVRTCAQQTMSSAAAQQQHQRCLTAMRISGPQTQLLNTSFHQDLSLSLSLSLFSCPLFRASSFGTSFYGPHYFSTSLQDSFSSGPRFQELFYGPRLSSPFQDHYSFPGLVFSQLSIFGPRFRTSFSDLIISPPCFRFTSLPDLVFRHSSFFTDLGSGPRFSTPSLPDLILELFYGPRFRTKTPSRSLVLGPLLRTSFQDLSSSGFSSSFILFFN